MKYLIGIIVILLGVGLALYVDLYLLITGIIDLIHMYDTHTLGGPELTWAIIKIAIRELVAGLIATICVAVGWGIMDA